MRTRTIPALLLLTLIFANVPLAAQVLVAQVLAAQVPAGVADPGADDPLARGDAAWHRRHEGLEGIRAASGPIGEAVVAYEKALARNPESLEVYWKLLRALQFQGDHTTDDLQKEKRIFARGKEVSEQALNFLAQRVGGRKVLDQMKAEEFPSKFPEPEVARIYFWATANWGQWAQAYGNLAAVRQGVGGRVRDYIRIVIALDPEYEDGGGYRIHARLHTEAPKVPFFTGWIDRKVAIVDSRRAFQISPNHPYNLLFLADALLRFDKKRKNEALAILRRLVKSEPRPEHAAADAVALAEARELLKKSEP